MANSQRDGMRSMTVNINNSQGFQVGDHNVQHIADCFVGLVKEIEASAVPDEEKTKAKRLIKNVLENPTVAAVLGSATSAVVSLLG